MSSRADRHREAGLLHAKSAKRHDQAAEHWQLVGDEAPAEFEKRNAQIERDAAQLERERGDYEDGHPLDMAPKPGAR